MYSMPTYLYRSDIPQHTGSNPKGLDDLIAASRKSSYMGDW